MLQVNSQAESTETQMNSFTHQTLWTAAPQKATFDASQVTYSPAQVDQLASALKNVSPTMQDKLNAFRSIALSEAAAFVRVR